LRRQLSAAHTIVSRHDCTRSTAVKSNTTTPNVLLHAGTEILIVRGGQPAAKLVPVDQLGKRPLGTCPEIRVADDFDAPLPDDLVDTFYR
jgi:antitoxin (DNA-binding transcriptional repressor) of toxin-antitoxin stability system